MEKLVNLFGFLGSQRMALDTRPVTLIVLVRVADITTVYRPLAECVQ